MRFAAISTLLLCLQALTSSAANPPAPQRPTAAPTDRPKIPPREAFAACEGKREGDVVTFTTPRGDTLKGPCRMIPAQLAAMPDRPPRPPEGRDGNPPPAPAGRQADAHKK